MGGDRTAGGALGGTLVRSVTANVAGRLVSMVAWIVVTPAMLSAMGAARFGLWSLVATLTGLSLTLDFGVAAAVTRFVAAARERGDEDGMRGALGAGVLVALALGSAWCVASALWPELLLDFARVGDASRAEGVRMLRVMGFAFVLHLVALALTSALSAFQRFDLASRNLLLSTLVQFVGLAIAASRQAPLDGFAWASVAGAAVSLALAAASLRGVWPGARWGGRAVTALALREFRGFGVALQFVNFGVLALFQLPKLLLARGVSLEAVGQYELGLRVAFSAWSLPTLLLPPLLPAAAQLQAAGQGDRLARLHARASRYLFALAMPLAATLAALSVPLYAYWLGPGHAAEARANAAIALLLAVNVLTSAGALLARGLGRPWWEAGYLGGAFVLQLALGLPLTRTHGFDGALVAMFAAGTTGTAAFLALFHRALRIPLGAFLRDVAAPPFTAASLGALAGWAASGAPWQALADCGRGDALAALVRGGAASALVTTVALFALRALRTDELRELWAAARARGAGGGAA